MMNAADKEKFEKAYSASYLPAKEILQEIYDEVKSGTSQGNKHICLLRCILSVYSSFVGAESDVLGYHHHSCASDGL